MIPRNAAQCIVIKKIFENSLQTSRFAGNFLFWFVAKVFENHSHLI